MNDAKTILILHPHPEVFAVAAEKLADTLNALGAKTVIHEMTARYDEVLDAVASASTIVVWR
ncbi:MAG: hypothetical protein ACYDHY_13875 [Acidiferrobacterales bacterium]